MAMTTYTPRKRKVFIACFVCGRKYKCECDPNYVSQEEGLAQ